jgi:hypothetical protein
MGGIDDSPRGGVKAHLAAVDNLRMDAACKPAAMV